MQSLCGGELVELGAGAGDGDGVFAEVEAGGFAGGFGFEHAVAGFRGAAGFGNHHDQRAVEAGFGELGEHAVHAVGVGVVEEVEREPRVRPRASETSCGPSAEPPMPISRSC